MSRKDMRGQGKYRFGPGRKVWGRGNMEFPVKDMMVQGKYRFVLVPGREVWGRTNKVCPVKDMRGRCNIGLCSYQGGRCGAGATWSVQKEYEGAGEV